MSGPYTYVIGSFGNWPLKVVVYGQPIGTFAVGYRRGAR